MHTYDHRHEPSLVQNGTFSQGLAHWFGSYVRHFKGPQGVDLGIAPTYEVRISGDVPSGYLDGIPSGINQFLDVPELYTFPSARTATLLRVTYVGDNLFLLTQQEGTRLNGVALQEGDITSSGSEFFFQHPFLFRDQQGDVEPALGSPMSLSSTEFFDLTGEYRTGVLFRKDGVDDQSESFHSLQVFGATEILPDISRLKHFPEVSVFVGALGGAGFGNVLFSGPGVEGMPGFVRPDGTTKIRINDTLIANGVAVRIASMVGDVFTDPSTGLVSYNGTYEPLPGQDTVESAFDTLDWTIVPTATADATYEMPLFRYDYTLGYSFKSPNSSGAAELQFRTLSDDGTISSIGEISDRILSAETELLNVTVEGSQPWRKRFERLVKEFSSKPDGRLLLNIPPSEEVVGDSELVLTSLQAVGLGTGSVVRAIAVYEADPDGLEIADVVYNNSTRGLFVRLSASTPSTVVVGSQIMLTGYHTEPSTSSTDDWLEELLDAEVVLTVSAITDSTVGTSDVLNITVPAGVTTSSGSAIVEPTFATSTVRVSTNIASISERFKQGRTARFVGTASTNQSFFEQVLGINKPIIGAGPIVTTSTSASVDLAILMDFPGNTLPQVQTFFDATTDISIRTLNPSQDTAIIGDVALWQGDRFQRLPVDDDTSVDDISTADLTDRVTIDPMERLVDPESIISPKGVVTLYAGGGACPTGYVPVRGLPETLEPGIGALSEIPFPSTVVYNPDTDLTTLTYDGVRFDRLAPNGEALTFDELDTFVQVALPGLFDANGDPVVQRQNINRTKQLVEPGMVLRAQDAFYADGRSELVDSGLFREVDFLDPFASEDRGFLITDVRPTGSAGGSRVVGTAHPFINPALPGNNTEGSTFGNGRGSLSYPSVKVAEFEAERSNNFVTPSVTQGYPDVPPAGPSSELQNQRFNSGFGAFSQPGGLPPFGVLMVKGREPQTVGALLARGMGQGGSNDNVPGFVFDGRVVFDGNDAFQTLANLPDGDPDRTATGDVYNAHWFVWTGDTPESLTGDITFGLAGGANAIDASDLNYMESFLCEVVLPGTSGDGDWRVRRYDGRAFRFFGLGQPDYPKDDDGDAGSLARIKRSFLILTPAKLFGTPGSTQADLAIPDLPGEVSPQGTGATFQQDKLFVGADGRDYWVANVLSGGTTIEVAGEFIEPSSAVSGLFVEPSGYLRYGDPRSMLDYGAGGHTHAILPNTGLQMSNPLPRTLPDIADEYDSFRLPVAHGHAALETVRYPLPAAELFTLCQKL